MDTAQKGKKILIVEDEKAISHGLQLKLQAVGYDVKVANNGQEGLDLLMAEHFDVLLLDIMMPVMDGFQVLKKLTEAKKTVPSTFVLSNLSQPEDEQRALEYGARKVFVKSDTPLSQIADEISRL